MLIRPIIFNADSGETARELLGSALAALERRHLPRRRLADPARDQPCHRTERRMARRRPPLPEPRLPRSAPRGAEPNTSAGRTCSSLSSGCGRKQSLSRMSPPARYCLLTPVQSCAVVGTCGRVELLVQSGRVPPLYFVKRLPIRGIVHRTGHDTVHLPSAACSLPRLEDPSGGQGLPKLAGRARARRRGVTNASPRHCFRATQPRAMPTTGSLTDLNRVRTPLALVPHPQQGSAARRWSRSQPVRGVESVGAGVGAGR